MTSSTDVSSPAMTLPAAGAPRARKEGYLFGPVTDFLYLGGASLIVLAIIAVMVPSTMRPAVAVTFALLAHVCNHPHFAHSYQIFYRGFGAKAFAWSTPAALRLRYIFAGIIVPVLLITFFAVTVANGDARTLGQGINLMAFLVGWHYVKQGYGMLIVDSVLKKNTFDATEKKILLLNAYTMWAATWLYGNHAIATRDMWGLQTYTFGVPLALATAALVLAGLTSLGAVIAICHRRRYATNKPFPWAGAAGYVAGLYVWLLAGWAEPMLILAIPFFHSLQYMAVVWRFELNRQNGIAPDGTVPAARRRWDTPKMRFAMFSVLGILLGYIGFWALPQFLDRTVAYDREIFGGTLFLFMFWIFINVHHYFLDNVMWRRENPEMGRYLFAAR